MAMGAIGCAHNLCGGREVQNSSFRSALLLPASCSTGVRSVRTHSKRTAHIAVVELVREEEEIDVVDRLSIPVHHSTNDHPSTSQPSHTPPRRKLQHNVVRTSRHCPKNNQVKGSSWSKDADVLVQDKFVGNMLRDALRHSPQRDQKPQPLRLPTDMDKFAQTKRKSKLCSFYAGLCERRQLSAALQLLHLADKHQRHDVLSSVNHRDFMAAAAKAKRPKEALRFLQTLPREHLQPASFHLALQVCEVAQDVGTCLHVFKVMDKAQVAADLLHYTAAIAVCRAAGAFEPAFRLFNEARSRGIQLDSHAYSALFSSAAATIRKDPQVSTSRKEQLVMLERVLHVLEEAVNAHVPLNAHVWNSVIHVAARSQQLQRAFQLLDQMQAAGVHADMHTYGSLIEACVLAKEPELALRLFNNALKEGFTSSPQIYTAAINACMIAGRQDFDTALEIYATMQRNHCEPDALVYGNLMALAGKVGKLDFALELVNDMVASGIRLGRASCSALIYACLHTYNPSAALMVYDTLRFQGIMPHISQVHSLMEHFAMEFNLGKVVELFGHVLEAKVKPSVNTFRILITACQRAGQPELAFEVLGAMKARGLIPREANASRICYQLTKACFNRIRERWTAGGYPPTGPASMSMAPPPATRTPEAIRLLEALRSRGHHAGPATYLDNADSINWSNLATSTYKDFVASGARPHVKTLDKTLCCLRLQLQPERAEALDEHQHGSSLLQEMVREQYAASKDTQLPEHRFDRRAVLLLEDAISMSMLPGYSLDDEELEIDMTSFPPTVTEAYVMSILAAIEQRINAPVRKRLPHITLIVPPFDPNYINWPSYVEKLNLYYNDVMSSVDSTWEDDDLGSIWGGRDSSEGGSNGSSGHWASTSNGSYDEEDEFEYASPFGTSLFPPRSSRKQQRHRSKRRPLDSTVERIHASKDGIIGLAAAATLRRMKLFASMDWQVGRISLEPREMIAWSENKRRAESLAVQQPEKLSAMHSLGDQQRNIRLGLGPGSSGGSSSSGTGSGVGMPNPQPWIRRPSMPGSL